MSIIESLRARADLYHQDVLRWRDEIAQHEAAIERLRTKIAEAELESVESMSSAHFLEQAGFRVDRTEDGIPRVAVDRTLVDRPVGNG